MQVKNHLLHLSHGIQAAFAPTKNLGGAIHPLYLVVHYTAGVNAKGTIEWFARPESKVSAHLVIDRDGSITQMVPFDRRAWHAGKSRWGELTDLNSYSIGIELVNAGKLRGRSDGRWLTDFGLDIPASEVTQAVHKHEQRVSGWHEYTEEQLRATVEVGSVLAEKYKLLDVLGHDDIAPTRKVDPGPLFPMDGVRSRVLGREAFA